MQEQCICLKIWTGSAWQETNEVRFIYDGYMVVQERNANNLPTVTYTRGNDLSGTLQGAGGIGGLLARTDMSLWVANEPFASAYYFSDGQGNVVAMVNTNGAMVAQYQYDPFGNLLVKSGPLADANRYRFSSKEWNDGPNIYYYGYRFYDPNLQRWLNRDPIQEYGGYNLFTFVANSVVNVVDILGLGDCPTQPSASPTGPQPDPNLINNFPALSYDLPPSSPPSSAQPATQPLQDFGQALGNAVAQFYGPQALQMANNVWNQANTAEQLGLGTAAAGAAFGAYEGGLKLQPPAIYFNALGGTCTFNGWIQKEKRGQDPKFGITIKWTKRF